ncbi:MAG: helix-turn-helix transcriptional regulator [Lachnospiraceae bacterium]|nr:helix-turn-helix transcriptional regulator [Lachnospiraceae bacterium]
MLRKYERIRNLREDRDLTQQQLADHLHVAQRTYSRYENGEHSIPTEVWVELAKYHNTSIDYLVELTNDSSPSPKDPPKRNR